MIAADTQEAMQRERPPLSVDAVKLMGRLSQLLGQRHRQQISRVVFLQRWGVLREALARTDEYQALRRRVAARARGGCQGAGCTRQGEVMHHEVPVARAPFLALDIRNVRWLCGECHAKVHPWMKEVRDGWQEGW